MLDAIAAAAEGSLGAAVFFGSRSSGVATTSASAYDLMLVCRDPYAFYRAAHHAGVLQRSPRLLAACDRFLPPTQVRLAGDHWLVKATVVSFAAVGRATSEDRKDQFLAGRLFQDVHIVWAKDDESAACVEQAIKSARRVTLDWVAPDLPASFDASTYVLRLFRTSFGFEVRPETSGRADALCRAQGTRLVPVFQRVLEEFVAGNRLVRNLDATFSLARPVTPGYRVRRRAFLEWSRVRATGRWPKHAVTFDGWLDYIIKKAERHSGETIVLTPLERRFPFLLLWPKLFRFLGRQRGKGRTV